MFLTKLSVTLHWKALRPRKGLKFPIRYLNWLKHFHRPILASELINPRLCQGKTETSPSVELTLRSTLQRMQRPTQGQLRNQHSKGESPEVPQGDGVTVRRDYIGLPLQRLNPQRRANWLTLDSANKLKSS